MVSPSASEASIVLATMTARLVDDEYLTTVRAFENILSDITSSDWPPENREQVEIKLDNIITTLHSWRASFGENFLGLNDKEQSTSVQVTLQDLRQELDKVLSCPRDLTQALETVNWNLGAVERCIQRLPSALTVARSQTRRLKTPTAPSVVDIETRMTIDRKIRQLHCDIRATCDDLTISYRDRSFGTRMLERNFARAVLDSASRRIRSHSSGGALFGEHFIYLWYGNLKLTVDGDFKVLWFLGDVYEIQTADLQPLMHEMLFDKAEASVALELNFILSAVPIYPIPGAPLTPRLQTALQDKISLNWIGSQYISYIHANAILTEEVLVYLVVRDETFDAWEDDPLDKAKGIVRFWLSIASCMLMTCLVLGQELTLLDFLVKQGINDHNFSSELVREVCGPASVHLHPRWENLLKLEPRFKARRLPATRDVFELKSGEILPVFYDESRGRIRPDGRSEVHKVRIEPGYHEFSKNPVETFLLKKLSISKGFSRESAYKGLSQLTHEHLVTHLGGWSTDHELFLLFPASELTLTDFLQRPRWPRLTTQLVDMILRQVAGIAGAINYLSQLETIRKGFHHDIRPGNILLFANDSKENFTWRLGTFGTDIETFAEMHRTDTGLEHGHPYPYQHPGLPHHASGKYDVWSFGCVCVELLRWLTAPYLSLGSDGRKVWEPGTTFWERDYTKGGAVVKPTVVQLLDTIALSTTVAQPLRRLANLTRQCLVIDDEERIEPSLLEHNLKSELGILNTESQNSRIHESASQDWESDGDSGPEILSTGSQRSSRTPRSIPSLTFSATTLKSSNTTLAANLTYSHLDGVFDAIDGWSIDELGLGVEPHFAEKVEQWEMLSADEHLLDSKAQNLTESAVVTPKLQYSKTTEPADSLKLVVTHEGPGKALRQGEIPLTAGKYESSTFKTSRPAKGTLWKGLSADEQTACIDTTSEHKIGPYTYYQPVGVLRLLWQDELSALVSSIMRSADYTGSIADRGPYSYQFIVIRQRGNGQLIPTILITSSNKKAAKQRANAIRISPNWQKFDFDFDVLALNDIVHFI